MKSPLVCVFDKAERKIMQDKCGNILVWNEKEGMFMGGEERSVPYLTVPLLFHEY